MKVGILGGGQLGRMLLQAAANYDIETFVMEDDSSCPSAHLCNHFKVGNIRNYEDVLQFGRNLDAITIEIESVNELALFSLEQAGVTIIPSVKVLKTIKNKINQKTFFEANKLPTAPFVITEKPSDILENMEFLPAFHKIAEGGYDGKGVKLIETPKDVANGFTGSSVLEKKISIQKELAVLVAVGQDFELAVYDPVEMVFHPTFHLLDYQLVPADMDNALMEKAKKIATHAIKLLGSPGLFAVEMFLDPQNNILINEIAPRVHNSGHHTIEACFSSQFDMLWRIILKLPLGNPSLIIPFATLVNLVGEESHEGIPRYQGFHHPDYPKNAFLHLYGKKLTKPGRKMGHVTIIGNEKKQVVEDALKVKEVLRVTS